MIAASSINVEEGASAGARILERPRRERPDAVFAANDLLALGLLQSLIVAGRMLVPDEIAIIGFDDIPFAAAAAVPLSSMRQPARMIVMQMGDDDFRDVIGRQAQWFQRFTRIKADRAVALCRFYVVITCINEDCPVAAS